MNKRPNRTTISDKALLALAAKKAFKFLDRRQWYHDRTESTAFMARLNSNVTELARQIGTGSYSPGPKTVFAAPKRVEVSKGSKTYKYRPLCTQSFRDEVVEIALLSILATDFERNWGDVEDDQFPKLWSFGNRLHRVEGETGQVFSVGNARLFRDWPDDYARFVKDTEQSFNRHLTALRSEESVVLICTDLKSFYPSIDRDLLAVRIKERCGRSLWPLVERLFGQYEVVLSDGCDSADENLKNRGLGQGPAHSGFWANVYLEDFDSWVIAKLTARLAKEGLTGSLSFYARYVDDMRLLFRCKTAQRERLIDEAKLILDEKLKKYGLWRSSEKTTEIVQDSTGSLLSTGQVAERMQSITKRAYFPLPPETLQELAKEVRLLFHAETNVPFKAESTDNELPQLLDNPGVRTDSRRRFAASKWAAIARDLDKMEVSWGAEKAIFSRELVRVWHEDPGQTQLLFRALQLGLPPTETTKVLKRLKQLQSQESTFGYHAFVLSYLFDSLLTSTLVLKGWPMVQLAKDVFKERCRHPVLLNKAQHYLLKAKRKMSKAEIDIPPAFRDPAWVLRNTLENRLIEPRMDEFEEIGILCSLRSRDETLKKAISALVATKTDDGKERVLLALLQRRPEIALTVAEENHISFIELSAFANVYRLGEAQGPRPLYEKIRTGHYRSPIQWCVLAESLGRFVRIKKNRKLAAKGLLNPFALGVDEDGAIVRVKNHEMSTFRGYAPQKRGAFVLSNTPDWALPVGLLLKAAATGRAADILGSPTAARFGLAGSFSTVLKAGGKIPEQCGKILDKLLTWHGSRIEGYNSVPGFLHEVALLHSRLLESSSGSAVICDVALPDLPSHSEIFNVLLCQVPSYPAKVSDAMIRRALTMSQLIVQQNGCAYAAIDLVVFPELAVPLSSLRTLFRFVRHTGTAVVAGLELRTAKNKKRQLNELIWIVPLDDGRQFIAALIQEKIHITKREKVLEPPILPADPPIIWRIVGPKGRIAAINCYEFTDLMIRDLLRGRVEGLVIAANNQDVTTFDNLVESTHFDLFCHVILVNALKFGGSAIRAPYKQQWDRRIFDIHGCDLFAVNICPLNLKDFRGKSAKPKKSEPAGFALRR
jgi:hypothetical protein